jgi:NAD(P)-dependent dehydrogenase (short-subunit alcohol dehydrogenase family)
MNTLEGKRALVTGGSTGIGFAIARALAEAGARVVLAARNKDRLENAVRQLSRDGYAAEALTVDVGDETSVEGAVAQAGTFDILVNNAGVHRPQPLLEIDAETFDRLFRVNVRGVFLVSRAVARSMVKAGAGGVIVNISSTLGSVGAAGRITYSATKHAVEGITKSMALDLAPHKIRVVAIAPTFTETEMTAAMLASPQFREGALKEVPIGRFGTPADIAGIVVFVASQAADMITGSTIFADGGLTAR